MTSSVPTPIEPVHYDQPRQVKLRDPSDPNNVPEVTHDAVRSAINIYVLSQAEENAIMTGWTDIMQACADKANEILAPLRTPSDPTPPPSS